MNQLSVLFVLSIFCLYSCQFNTKEIDEKKSELTRGYIKPGKVIAAGNPEIKVIDQESLNKIQIRGSIVSAGKPNVISYLPAKTSKINPQKQIVDTSKIARIIPGKNGTNKLRKLKIPKTGYLIQFEDTIYSPSSKLASNPKPVPALPMRFKDAAIYNIKYMDVEQGMPSSFVYSMLEDRKKNLWFGTYGGGVARYDGKSFFTFNEERGLNNNRIRKIYEDSDENIWFATNGGGVTKYDGHSFTTYSTAQGLSSDRVYCMMQDSKGNFWFGTNGGGVNKFDGDSLTIYAESNGLADNQIYSIIEDKNGMMWFGSNSGKISMFDGDSFRTFSHKHGLSNNVVRSMVEDQKGNIWIGTNGGGLTKYDGKSFITYSKKDGLINDFVLSILEDKKGNLWIGTYGGGVNKFDGKIFTSLVEKDGLSSNTIMSFLEDDCGKIWIGTNGGGVSRFDAESFITYEHEEGIGNHPVRSILKDNDNHIWLGTDGGGISMFDGKSFTTYKTNTGLGDDDVYAMILDKNKSLWIGTRRGGVTKFDGKNFTVYSSREGLPNNNIRSLLEDKKGNVWFGSYGSGLFKYKDNLLTQFTEKDGLKNAVIRCIYEDSQGNIWVGTDGGGVSKYDGNSIATYTEKQGLANNIIMSIYEDRIGNMWFGTWGNGISKFDGKYFQNFSVADGLTHNLILSFVEDNQGKIWAGTGSGINILSDPKGNAHTGTTFRHRKLEKSDGLKRLDIGLNSVWRDDENRIWWGMGKGFTMLNINNYGKGNELSKVQLNGIGIMHEFIDYRMLHDSTYRRSISFGKELTDCFDSVASYYNYPTTLTLPYNLNHLTFNFSAIDWLAHENIEYQYMIPELDDQWSTPSRENKAEYRNLPYGSYTFHVRAIGSNEIWGNPLTYEFKINPPWWHSWLARLLYIISALILLYSFISWRTRNYKSRQMEMEFIIAERIEEINTQAEQLRELNDKLNLSNETLEKTVEERTSELEYKNKKLSEYAFTNAHELRAPVANLLGLIQLFDKKRSKEEVDQLIELLKQVAIRLDEITYEIRDRLEKEGFDIES